jgi:hypothetical protein
MATHHPIQPQTLPECPRCGRTNCARVPVSVLGSTERWFECLACHHLWMQQRDESRGKQDDVPAK